VLCSPFFAAAIEKQDAGIMKFKNPYYVSFYATYNDPSISGTKSRAKALMIVVGNPNTLRNDPEWHNFLKFCQDNGGCTTPIDIGPRPQPTTTVTNSMHDVHADFRKMFSEIKEKLSVEDFM
jgi:hypothetical protein